jgi:hypothetical protein
MPRMKDQRAIRRIGAQYTLERLEEEAHARISFGPTLNAAPSDVSARRRAVLCRARISTSRHLLCEHTRPLHRDPV